MAELFDVTNKLGGVELVIHDTMSLYCLTSQEARDLGRRLLRNADEADNVPAQSGVLCASVKIWQMQSAS